MYGDQPDVADAGNAHRRHPLLKRGIAERLAPAQREAGVDRGVGDSLPRIAQRVPKALIPAVFLEGRHSSGRGLDQDHDIGVRCLFRDVAGVGFTVEHVQAHQPELRRRGSSMIIDEERRQPRQMIGSQHHHCRGDHSRYQAVSGTRRATSRQTSASR